MSVSLLQAWPNAFSFKDFAFADPGSTLRVDAITREGYRPGVDFGYPYGPLPVILAWPWFSLVGRTPSAFVAAEFIIVLGIGWAMIRFVRAAGNDRGAAVLLTATLPFSTGAFYPSLTHCLETLVLAHALAFQMRGQRAAALAGAAVAAFIKPSMGYVYGGLIVAWLAIDVVRKRLALRAALRTVAPAVVTYVGLAVVAAATFGVASMLRTTFPLVGAKNYAESGYGILGLGRYFWHPPGATVKYYVGTAAGLWLVLTALLLAAPVVVWLRRRDDPTTPPAARAVVLTCALCHVAFVAVFFGNTWSWFYYSLILAFGVAAALACLPRRWSVALALVLLPLAILSNYSRVTANLKLFGDTAPRISTRGLWTPADLAEEWEHVLVETARPRTAFLALAGDVAYFAPAETPRWWMLAAGYSTPRMQSEALALVRSHDRVIMTVLANHEGELAHWPALAAAVHARPVVWRGRYFTIYEGTSPAAARP